MGAGHPASQHVGRLSITDHKSYLWPEPDLLSVLSKLQPRDNSIVLDLLESLQDEAQRKMIRLGSGTPVASVNVQFLS